MIYRIDSLRTLILVLSLGCASAPLNSISISLDLNLTLPNYSSLLRGSLCFFVPLLTGASLTAWKWQSIKNWAEQLTDQKNELASAAREARNTSQKFVRENETLNYQRQNFQRNLDQATIEGSQQLERTLERQVHALRLAHRQAITRGILNEEMPEAPRQEVNQPYTANLRQILYQEPIEPQADIIDQASHLLTAVNTVIGNNRLKINMFVGAMQGAILVFKNSQENTRQ